MTSYTHCAQALSTSAPPEQLKAAAASTVMHGCMFEAQTIKGKKQQGESQ